MEIKIGGVTYVSKPDEKDSYSCEHCHFYVDGEGCVIPDGIIDTADCIEKKFSWFKEESMQVVTADEAVAMATDVYGSNEIEIEIELGKPNNFSNADNGVWVRSWVWLPSVNVE